MAISFLFLCYQLLFCFYFYSQLRNIYRLELISNGFELTIYNEIGSWKLSCEKQVVSFEFNEKYLSVRAN
jgi:hypothetical protein